MLRITVIGEELYNEETNEFVIVDSVVLDLEHSLVSLSKWEAMHEKPFLSNTDKTRAEIFSYISCMLLTPNVSQDTILNLSTANMMEIQKYIDSKQSATSFNEMSTQTGIPETITSELIYYWMVAFNIPLECQYWHLNRLFSLIRICNIKNSKPTQMTPHETAQKYRELNAQRKAQYNTRG